VLGDPQQLFESLGIPLLEGLGVTIQVFLGALVLATVLGLVVGTARLSKIRIIRYVAIGFVEFFRGTAALVQLFWVFYALPLIFGLPLPPLWAAWVVIGCNQGAYLAEVVRGAILAVPTGQIEASIAINLHPRTRWRRVILPQAVPIILPTYTNHVISILKETAIVSLIGVADMTHVANTLRTQFANTSAIFLTIALLYLLCALIIAWLGRVLERRFDVYRPRKAPSRRVLQAAKSSA
jgi:polar amino acid transport system permease protein